MTPFQAPFLRSEPINDELLVFLVDIVPMGAFGH
jgi:hypothetical protein